MAPGIRTAALLPHFRIVTFMTNSSVSPAAQHGARVLVCQQCLYSGRSRWMPYRRGLRVHSEPAGRQRRTDRMAEWDAGGYYKQSSLQKWLAGQHLASLTLAGGERALDVGCGDGAITA